MLLFLLTFSQQLIKCLLKRLQTRRHLYLSPSAISSAVTFYEQQIEVIHVSTGGKSPHWLVAIMSWGKLASKWQNWEEIWEINPLAFNQSGQESLCTFNHGYHPPLLSSFLSNIRALQSKVTGINSMTNLYIFQTALKCHDFILGLALFWLSLLSISQLRDWAGEQAESEGTVGRQTPVETYDLDKWGCVLNKITLTAKGLRHSGYKRKCA